MDLSRLDNLEYLQQISKDENLLMQEIENTRGFVLEKLKSSKIFPSIDILFNNINAVTLQFIVDNYTLNKEQNEKIADLLRDDSKENRSLILNLSPQEVEEYLKSGNKLPRNTILTIEQINSFQSDIQKQEELDNYNMELILKNSTRQLNHEDFFKLDRNFLKNNLYLLNRSSLFNNKQLKNYYKELRLELDDENNEKPHLNDFSRWHFEENDKPFLLELLKNYRYGRPQYSELCSIPGFSNLLSKEEYFSEFNHKDLSSFTDGQVEKQKEFFKKVWLEKTEFNSYDTFSELLRHKCSLKQFMTIVDVDFIGNVFEKQTSRDFSRPIDSREKEEHQKFYYLTSVVLDTLVNKDTFNNGRTLLQSYSIYPIFHLLENFERDMEKYKSYKEPVLEEVTKLNQKNIEKLYSEILPKFLSNDNIYDLISHTKYVFKPEFVGNVKDFVEKQPSINSFFVLVKHYVEASKNRYDYNKHQYLEHIGDFVYEMGSHLISKEKNKNLSDKDFESQAASVHIILEHFSNQKMDKSSNENTSLLKIKKKLKTEQSVLSNIKNIITKTSLVPNDYNFFAYEGKHISQIETDLLFEITTIRPQFLNYINKNKWEVPSSFLSKCLYNVENGEMFKFLKDYASIHRTEIESNEEVMNLFLGSSKQKEIFPTQITEEEKQRFKEILNISLRQKNIATMRSSIEDEFERRKINSDSLYSRENINLPHIDIENFDETSKFELATADNLSLKARYIDLYQKSSSLDKKASELNKKLSFQFMEYQVQQTIEQKDWDLLLELKDRIIYSNHNELFVNYVNNCDYQELTNNLQNKSFCKIIREQISYEGKTDIQFKKFTDEQNSHLAELLQKTFSERYSDSKDRDPNVFYFFALENRGFIKKYAIDNMPHEAIYGYALEVSKEDSYKPRNFINEQYTFEEMYQTYVSAQAQGGIFAIQDVNAEYNKFFANPFSTANYRKKGDNPEAKNKIEQYIKFLDYAKEKDETFYALAAGYRVIESVVSDTWVNSDNEKKTRDQVTHEFFVQHVDIDVFLKGLKKICDNIENNPEAYVNKRPMQSAFLGLLHSTVYEEMDQSNYSKREKKSLLSEENKLKIFKFFYENNPSYLFSTGSIAGNSDTNSFFKNHINEFNQLSQIEKFLFPKQKLMCDYCGVSGDHWAAPVFKEMCIDLVTSCIEKQEIKTIEWLAYMIKQHQFIEKEVGYGTSRLKSYRGCSDMFMDALAVDNVVNALLDKAKLKIELEQGLKFKEFVPKPSKKKI